MASSVYAEICSKLLLWVRQSSKSGAVTWELPESGMSLPDLDQLIRPPIRQSFDQDFVNHAEDRGVRADTERDGKDSSEREGRPAAERAKSVPHSPSIRLRRQTVDTEVADIAR